MERRFIAKENKIRLDKYLSSLSGESRSRAKQDIQKGRVEVNGNKIQDIDFLVNVGDTIVYESIPKPEKNYPKDLPISVLYENKDLLVVDKPAGISVHPGAGTDGDFVTQMLLFRFPEIALVGEQDRPGIVHRLDKETSGCLLVAKNQSTYRYLLQCFASKKVEKTYIALVYGNVDNRLFLSANIGKSKVDFRKMTTHDPKVSKQALTEVLPLEHYPISPKPVGGRQFDETTLILVKLHTGRTHQIRVHLSSIGCPLVGDKLYAGKNSKLFDLQRQFLHAKTIAFPEAGGGEIKVESLLPQDLRNILVRLGSKKVLSL